MIFKDYYKILGLKNSNVTSEEIKQAYREQAKKYHPDINTTSNFAEERFKDINEAYKTLSNSSSRRKYDRMWNSRIGKKQKNKGQAKKEKKSVFAQFFEMFFGEIKQKEKSSSKTEKRGAIQKMDRPGNNRRGASQPTSIAKKKAAGTYKQNLRLFCITQKFF